MSTITNNALSTNLTNIYNRNQSYMAKALTQTASGQRIVSAKDGPSDWAISERMLERTYSLQQNKRNAQNGNAMLKTAEGGIQNTVDILTTIKERVLNAANAHNNDDDIDMIQKEVDKLIEQVDANVDNVKFNGKKLLNGDFVNNASLVKKATAQATSIKVGSGVDGTTALDSNTFGVESTAGTVKVAYKNEGDSTATEVTLGTNLSTSSTLSDFVTAANSALGSAANFEFKIIASGEVIGKKDDGTELTATAADAGLYAIAKNSGVDGGFSVESITGSGGTKNVTGTDKIPAGDANSGGGITLQIGDEADLTITFGISKMDFKSLSGSSTLDVTSSSALTTIDKALTKALEAGTEVGTAEQRLGYVSDNIDTQIENIENSYSTIREADMAKTVTDYMKYTILSQAAQFMLAQNNQNASSVFTLLQP